MFLLKSCLLYPFPWKISEFSPTSILLIVKSALLDGVNTIRVPLAGTLLEDRSSGFGVKRTGLEPQLCHVFAL